MFGSMARRRVLCACVVLTGLLVRAGQAAGKDSATTEPAKIVDVTVSRVLNFIVRPEYKDPAMKKANREKVREMILAVVNMNAVANLTLANFRSKFSEEQFKTFTEVFSQLLFTTYITHLEKYSGQRVVIGETERPSPTRAVVKTKTITTDKEIPVDLSFALQDGEWKLYDIRIEGVSLVQNYRSQFREILLKRTPEQFLQQLKDKVKENEEKS
ncbi:MAG: ABC transporter substrate-binding protein [Candidatus Sumerlaeia bacterium]|nr:ABC transporter substrate-binding protein [Candidatus Sumerlaeia bacterium]